MWKVVPEPGAAKHVSTAFVSWIKKMSNSHSNNKTYKNIKDDLECRASKPPSPSFVHFLHGPACSSGKSQAFLTWVLETRWCRQRWLTQLTFGRKGWWQASHWAESAFWQWWCFRLAGWRVVTLFLCLSLVSWYLGIIIFEYLLDIQDFVLIRTDKALHTI